MLSRRSVSAPGKTACEWLGGGTIPPHSKTFTRPYVWTCAGFLYTPMHRGMITRMAAASMRIEGEDTIRPAPIIIQALPTYIGLRT